MSRSVVEELAAMPADDREEHLATLSRDTLRMIVHRDWSVVARPEQRLPDGDWWLWLLLAGRGSGKTRSAAEALLTLTERLQPHVDRGQVRTALVAPTIGDVRDTMVEGDSGLLSVLPPSLLVNGSVDDSWNRSLTELTLSTGAHFKGFSSERPDKLRGPQHHLAWVEEAASLRDAHAGVMDDTTWSNLLFGLRLPPHPRLLVTTTPKRNALVKALDRDVQHAAWASLVQALTGRAVLDRPRVAFSRMSTYDNLQNLSPAFREQVVNRYEGTRLGRQELHGILLDDTEHALWQEGVIAPHRVSSTPPLERTVVGVDPSGTATGDEAGIVTCGMARWDDGTVHVYVLADDTLQASPDQWGRQSVAAYHRHDAVKIVAEGNNGADMVVSVIQAVDPTVPVQRVTATRGKALRAEPVVALYEQGRVHHVGYLPGLEEQMLSWEPGSGASSPDRIDALVWAITALLPDVARRPASISSPRNLAGALPTVGGLPGIRNR